MTETAISSSEPDWGRERPRRWWDPSRRLLKSIRSYQKWRTRDGLIGRIAAKVCVLGFRFWSAIAGAEIALNSIIQGGLQIPHPNGIVITPEASIGPNCLIFQQATIGTRGPRKGAPKIGGDVAIGAGARVLGPVCIGDHARIGANAVVLNDVPAWGVAVGVPATIAKKRSLTENETVPVKSDAEPERENCDEQSTA